MIDVLKNHPFLFGLLLTCVAIGLVRIQGLAGPQGEKSPPT
jgi:hypothetical protein